MKKVFKLSTLLAFLIAFLVIATHSFALPTQDFEEGNRADKPLEFPTVIPAADFKVIATHANKFLSADQGKGGRRAIYAQDLMDGKDDPNKVDELSDYYLLDIRTPEEFAEGHIAGSVNVPLGDVAKATTLAMLPAKKPILIICNTGHTASVANGVLSMLGYDAWTLRFGMVSWMNSSPTKVWSSKATQDLKGGNFPVVTGKKP